MANLPDGVASQKRLSSGIDWSYCGWSTTSADRPESQEYRRSSTTVNLALTIFVSLIVKLCGERRRVRRQVYNHRERSGNGIGRFERFQQGQERHCKVNGVRGRVRIALFCW